MTIKDTLQTIRHSSLRFFSGTLLSRLTGMLRDISMAYAFGTEASVAAFMVAFRLAHLLRRLLGEGAMQSAFIPEFEALRQESKTRAFCFFRDLTASLTLFLCVIILFLFACSAGCLSWGNGSESSKEVLYLTQLMLPSLLFICLFGLNASLLQCEKKFFTSSVAPVGFNLVWTLAVFALRERPVKEAMPWLALGVIAACAVQWLVTVPQVVKRIKEALPSFTFGLHLFSPDLKKLVKPLFLGIVGVAASQINNAMDALFARFATAEGPAFLWYAIRLEQLPLALFGIAIAGAILPPLARAIKARQRAHFDYFLQDAIYRTWSFMLPLSAYLLVLADTSIMLLYGRGDFTLVSAEETTKCLWAYGIGLVPSALVLVLAPAYYAQSNYRWPALASLGSMGCNLLFNSVAIFYLDWGAYSVAFATTAAAWINLLFLGADLWRQGTALLRFSLIKKSIAITLASLLAAIGTWVLRLHVESFAILSPHFFAASLLERFAVLIAETAIFTALLGVAYLLFWLWIAPQVSEKDRLIPSLQ